MFDINTQEDNIILVPTLNEVEILELSLKLKTENISQHYLLASSGTTGGRWKGYLISRLALLRNASAVNERLALTKDDIWGASLPLYHIGGLSIYFRAQLLGHSPIDLRPWSADSLVDKILKHKVTVISLVPTQVFDLVKLNITSPGTLKTVLVGGDFLSRELAERFTHLGWPLVRTFGMTEVSSQLCTGADPDGYYSPLPIHDIKTDINNNLFVRSLSLFSYRVSKQEEWSLTSISELLDHEGYLKLPDKASLSNRGLKILGRDDGHIKSSGHLISYSELRETLDRFCLDHQCWGEMEIQLNPTEREGVELILHCLNKLPEAIIDEFLHLISPVKIAKIKKQDLFNRTNLGKFKYP